MSLIVDGLDQPVYVITTKYQGENAGCVVTWVTKASLNQKSPRVLIVLSKFNDTWPLLLKSKRFVLNLLHAEQMEEFVTFGLYHSHETNKFEKFLTSPTAAGFILQKAAGHAQGVIEQVWETPDRIICYCSLKDEHKHAGPPLILRSALGRVSADDVQKLKLKMQKDTERDEKQFT